MSIPEDFTADERGGGWQTLLELFGEAPVPDKEQWKLAAMYNRVEVENAELKIEVDAMKCIPLVERIALLQDDNAALKARKRELSMNLKALQGHVRRCGKLLGCIGIDLDVENAIVALKAHVERLSAPATYEEWTTLIRSSRGTSSIDDLIAYRLAESIAARGGK